LSGTAKAFVVFNLVFALLFAGAVASYLVQRNVEREALKALQDKYDKETKSLNGQVAQLTQEKTNLQRQVDTLTSDKSQLETNLSNTKKDLDLEQKNRLEREARLAGLDDSYGELKRDYARLADRNEVLAKELADAKKTAEAAVAVKEDAVDKMREAEQRAEAAKNRFVETAKELQDTKKDLDRYRANYPEPGGKYTPAQVYGKVREVDPKVGLVVISVGEDDGVKAGMEFTVYRGSGYVTKVIVTTVDKELSVARVDKSVSKDEVKVGDNVSAAF
jgi:septal ring factor EnvC (AmiA/AmiB activator)